MVSLNHELGSPVNQLPANSTGHQRISWQSNCNAMVCKFRVLLNHQCRRAVSLPKYLFPTPPRMESPSLDPLNSWNLLSRPKVARLHWCVVWLAHASEAVSLR